MVHDPELAQRGRSAGGKAKSSAIRQEPGALAIDADFSDFGAIHSTLEQVADAILDARLDFRLGNTIAVLAQGAIQAHRAKADIAERERTRIEELSDAELDVAFDRAMERYLAKQGEAS